MKIGSKQLIGVSAFIIGVILIGIAAHGMREASEAKSWIDHTSDFFTNKTGIWNPLIEFFGGEARKEASKYDTSLWVAMYLGIALVISGLWAILHYKNSHRN